MSRYRWLLLGICTLALVPRVFSVTWNDFAHSDVIGDATAAASFQREGRLLASHNPDISSVPHFFRPGIERNLLTAHPPVWPLLGAGLSHVSGFPATYEHAFFSLRILSLAFGMLVIVLAAMVARRRFGEREALWTAALLGASYLMIDYAGNGSFYSLHASMYLLWVLAAYAPLRRKALWFGLISGIAYLVNQQAMVLAAASFLFLLIEPGRTHTQRIGNLCTVTAVTFLVSLPWLLRNYLIFGDLFFSHAVNATYVYTKAGLATRVNDGVIRYVVDLPARLMLLQSVLFSWLPNNLYYIARKLFILAPVLFFFFSFAWIDYLCNGKRLRDMLPIVLVLTLHILLSAAWPITKFRYFVPMYPLVIFVAVDQLRSMTFARHRQTAVYALTFALMVVCSYLTYVSVPTHTYYYDGAITQDPFHGRGEYEYVEELGLTPRH